MSLDNELTFLHTQAEAIITALALNDTDGGLTRRNRFHACHQLHIITKHPEGLLHNRVYPACQLVTDRMLPVEPHHIGGHRRKAYTKKKEYQ